MAVKRPGGQRSAKNEGGAAYGRWDLNYAGIVDGAPSGVVVGARGLGDVGELGQTVHRRLLR